MNFRDNNNVQQTRSFALNVVVTHPVNVLLPTPPAPRHDFGDVPLLTTPRSYGIFARETCGYKTGTVTLANPTQVPSFASVGGPQWNISAGSQTSISVSVRFASAHNALLYQNQSFSLQLRPSAVHPATTIVPTTYSFQARPVFINVAAFKVRLEEARGSSSFEDAREAGTMLLGLLINRTEVRPPRTEAEIADASRVVALVEPAAILIEQFDQMQTWNDEGLQQETVRALVAGAAAHQTLVAVCQSIQDAALRTQCDAALALLGDRSELFAQGAVEYFSGLNATGRSDLERERAASGLGFALAALGDADAAEGLEAIAEAHFQNFTAKLSAATNITEGIESREERYDGWAFSVKENAYVAWHPLGAVLLKTYADETRHDYASARSQLVAAGDPIRIEQLDAERRDFDERLASSFWTNTIILGMYGVAVLGAGLWSLNAYRVAKKTGRFGALGDFLLPERRGG